MSEEEKTTKIVYSQPVTITLSKGQRDSYGWEIKISGEDIDSVLRKIHAVDAELKARYRGGEMVK